MESIGFITDKKKKTIFYLKVNIYRTWNMGMEEWFLKMEIIIKAILKMISFKVMGNMYFKMENTMKEVLLRAAMKESANLFIKMDHISKDLGRTAKRREKVKNIINMEVFWIKDFGKMMNYKKNDLYVMNFLKSK